MKANKVILLLIFLSFFASCKKEDEMEEEKTQSQGNNSSLVEDGMMVFSSKEDLMKYVDGIDNQLSSSQSSSNLRGANNAIVLPNGFKPLADSYDEALNNARVQGDEYSAEVEQVINENLIPSEAMHYVLDAARRVKIGGSIYQVTEVGTFIYDETHEADFVSLHENFLDEYLSFSSQVDSITYQYGDILFQDTYGYVTRRDLSEEKIIDFISGRYETFGINLDETSSLVNARTSEEYTRIYGLRTERTPVSSWLSFLNVRTSMFDSKNRVAVAMDKFNIGIIKFANFKVKFQTKKTKTACVRIFGRRRCINLYSYWTKSTVPKMVIGMDGLEAKLTYAYNIPLESTGNSFNSWVSTAGGITSSMVYKGLFENRIVKDWKDNSHFFDARVNIFGNTINITEEAWKIATNKIKDEIKARSSSYIKNIIGYDQPAVAVIPRGKEELYVYNGIQEYTNKQDKKIKFPLASFIGFAGTLDIGGASTQFRPNMPDSNKFKFESGSIFGAAYYNGKWRGVRIEM